MITLYLLLYLLLMIMLTITAIKLIISDTTESKFILELLQIVSNSLFNISLFLLHLIIFSLACSLSDSSVLYGDICSFASFMSLFKDSILLFTSIYLLYCLVKAS